MLLKKIVITTLVAALVFGIVDIIVSNHLISLDALPYGPSFKGSSGN